MDDLVELVRTRYSKFKREIYGAFFFDTFERPLIHDLVFDQRIELSSPELEPEGWRLLGQAGKSTVLSVQTYVPTRPPRPDR